MYSPDEEVLVMARRGHESGKEDNLSGVVKIFAKRGTESFKRARMRGRGVSILAPGRPSVSELDSVGD
jgi:hypothetical protein